MGNFFWMCPPTCSKQICHCQNCLWHYLTKNQHISYWHHWSTWCCQSITLVCTPVQTRMLSTSLWCNTGNCFFIHPMDYFTCQLCSVAFFFFGEKIIFSELAPSPVLQQFIIVVVVIVILQYNWVFGQAKIGLPLYCSLLVRDRIAVA